MAEGVRVRFAPSPTGEPHLGNLRTALFNWLFARSSGGQFVVRVEDTDRERYVPQALGAIMESLRWLDLDWDEGPEVGGPHGPYFQSDPLRLANYRGVAEDLVHGGYAYHCYCSRERLDEMRQEQQRRKAQPGYDRHCRELTAQHRSRNEAEGIVPVVRFKVPMSGDTSVVDLIHGEVTWHNELLDDFVLLKSDGFPTYHLANVVDDHLMEITHVLRAEEWLSSTPRHIQIYRALGHQPPRFAHLPMILGPDHSKLSKRHGATSILSYKEEGYLPEAMVNFMALLGWSLDDKTDVMSRNVMVEHFSLDRVGKAGAIFDKDKLQWMNGVYIRQLEEDELAQRLVPFLEGSPYVPSPVDTEYLGRIVPLIRERLKTLSEAGDLTEYFFREDLGYEQNVLVQKGMDKQGTIDALGTSLAALRDLEAFPAKALEELLRDVAGRLGLSGRQLFRALRVAVTGRTASPPLFDTMQVLGKTRCLGRIDAAVAFLRNEAT